MKKKLLTLATILILVVFAMTTTIGILATTTNSAYNFLGITSSSLKYLGKTSTAVNGTAAALQPAIDAAYSGGGGTVYVNAGTFNLDGIVTVKENVRIVGAGIGSTIIDSGNSSSEYFYISNGYDNVRITGIEFQHADGTAGEAIIIGHTSGYTAVVDNFRIDHCKFDGFGQDEAAIWTRGTNTGVIDHNEFNCVLTSTGTGYGVVVYGDDVYRTDVSAYLGTAQNVFIEDNTFTGFRHAISGNCGGTYVARYNTISSNYVSQQIDAHGGSDVHAALNLADIGHNTITTTAASNTKAIAIRGGQAVIHDNYSSGYTYHILYMIEYYDNPAELAIILTHLIHDTYEWDNTDLNEIDWVVASTNNSTSYLHEGTDFFADTELTGYEEYTYPHPLTSESETVASDSLLLIATSSYVPVVSTVTATDIGIHTATLRGYLTSDAGSDCQYRFVWGETTSYGTESTWGGAINTGDSFSTIASSLSTGTTYHFRAEARIISGNTVYGSDMEFTAGNSLGVPTNFRAINTEDDSITLAWVNGSNAPYTWINYKTDGYPVDKIDGMNCYSSGATSVVVLGLSGGTTYYFRAWGYDIQDPYWSTEYVDLIVTTEMTPPIEPPVDPGDDNPIIPDASEHEGEFWYEISQWLADAYQFDGAGMFLRIFGLLLLALISILIAYGTGSPLITVFATVIMFAVAHIFGIAPFWLVAAYGIVAGVIAYVKGNAHA